MPVATKRRRKTKKDKISVRGFFRIQVTEGDPNHPETIKVVGDSGVDENGELINGDGWRENQITGKGFEQFLALTLAGMAGSKTISHMLVGTGGAPASNDTALSGEITHATNSRKTVAPTTAASTVGGNIGCNVSFAAAFNSADSFLTASANLSNVALVNTLTTNVGTIFAGNTYASSAVATNNNLTVTYAIRFA